MDLKNSNLSKNLIIIAGPTAVGKTSFGIDLAKHFHTEIISADSRQFYKELKIGTAIPEPCTLHSVKHYLIGHISIHDYYNVSLFENLALQIINSVFKLKDILILLGGSGLYINVICSGIDELPDPDKDLRNDLKELYQTSGISALRSMLKKLDPEYYSRIDLANPNRLLRALEVCIATGKNSIRWFGTDKGVSALSSDKWLTPDYDMYYPEMMFDVFPITSMATNLNGDSLYVGTEGAGVARVYRDDVDGISGASVYAIWGPIILPSDNIQSIYIASDGAKWFGTDLGIAKHTGDNTLENWTVYTTDEGLVDDFVQTITGDKEGKIWIGTKGGISVFNGSAWSSFTTDNGLISNNILSLAIDKDGSVWIGTDVGISCYKNGEFINY